MSSLFRSATIALLITIGMVSSAGAGMHIVIVAIEGDHHKEISDVLKDCKYKIEKTRTVKTGDEASKEMGKSEKSRVSKAVYVANGWTFIVDPEMVLMTDDIWLKYSKKWKNRVIGWICEDTSGTYGLAQYKEGKKQRLIVSVDGEIKAKEGTPLPEEAKFKWEDASTDRLMKLLKKIGPDYDYLADREYTVFTLNGSGKD
jgi:hypothetical protein